MTENKTQGVAADATGADNFIQDPILPALVGWQIVAACWIKGKLRPGQFSDRNIHNFLLAASHIGKPSQADHDDKTKLRILDSLRPRFNIFANCTWQQAMSVIADMLADLGKYNYFSTLEDCQQWVANRVNDKNLSIIKRDRLKIAFGIRPSPDADGEKLLAAIKDGWHNNSLSTKKHDAVTPAATPKPSAALPQPTAVEPPPPPARQPIKPKPAEFKTARPIQTKPPVPTTPVAPPPPAPTPTMSYSSWIMTGTHDASTARAAVKAMPAPTPPKVRSETDQEFAARLGNYLKPSFDAVKTTPDARSAIIDLISRGKLDYAVASETVNGAPRINLYALRQSLAQVLEKLAIEINPVSEPVSTTGINSKLAPSQLREYDGAKIKERITKIMPPREAQHATSLPTGLVATSRGGREH